MEDETANKIAQEDEYQLQYYGTTAGDIIKAVQTGVLEVIKKGLDEFEPEWLERNPYIDATVCRNYFATLYQEYATHTMIIMQTLESKLREILTIPSNVLLPDDKHQELQYFDKDIDDMQEELVELENEYIKKRAFKFLCQKELEMLEGLQPIREMVEDMLCKLDTLKTNNNTNTDESLRQTIEKHNKMTSMLMEKLFSLADMSWMLDEESE